MALWLCWQTSWALAQAPLAATSPTYSVPELVRTVLAFNPALNQAQLGQAQAQAALKPKERSKSADTELSSSDTSARSQALTVPSSGGAGITWLLVALGVATAAAFTGWRMGWIKHFFK